MIYHVHVSVKSTKSFCLFVLFLQVRQSLYENSDESIAPQKWPEMIIKQAIQNLKYIHWGPDLQNLWDKKMQSALNTALSKKQKNCFIYVFWCMHLIHEIKTWNNTKVKKCFFNN